MMNFGSWWASARDEIRFRLHDRISRRSEIENAALRFPIHDLQRQLAELEVRLAAELDRRFDAPMRTNREKLSAVRSVRAEYLAELAILDRDYKGELDAAYARMSKLKADRDWAKAAIRAANDELIEAKNRISSWHMRARSWVPIYGKRGKPIPKHSFFSFSQSDLISAKEDAKEAASRISGEIKKRNAASVRMNLVAQEIGEIKAGKAKRREMLDAGRTPRRIHNEIGPLMFEITRLEGAEVRLSSARAKYADSGPEGSEIGALRAKIALQHARRSDALEAFDKPASRDLRRKAFLSAEGKI